jgi:tetratricopeptide (TPR) repeat protein
MASSARIDELRKKFDENPRRYFAPLANEFRKAGDLEQAVFICQEYLPQQPGHMSGHIVYGQTLFELGRDEEAKAVFETALSLDPENLIALRHLGDIARQAGDMDVARFWYQRVLESDPRNDEIAQVLMSMEAAPGEAPPPIPEPTAPSAVEPVIASASESAHAAEPPAAPGATSELAEPGPTTAAGAAPQTYEPFEGFDRTIDFEEPTPSETVGEPDFADAAGDAADAGAAPTAADNDVGLVLDAAAGSAEPATEDLLDLDDFSIGAAATEQASDEVEAAAGATDAAGAELKDLPLDGLPTIDLDESESSGESPFDLPAAHGETAEPAIAGEFVEVVSLEDGGPITANEPDLQFEPELSAGAQIPEPMAEPPAERSADGVPEPSPELPIVAFAELTIEPELSTELESVTGPEPVEPEPVIELASDIKLGLPSDEPALVAEFSPEPALEMEPLATTSVSSSEPPAEAEPEPEHAASDEVFVTETMANLYMQQGHWAGALDIYEKLLAHNPGDARLHDRIRDVKQRIYGKSHETTWEPQPLGADGTPATAVAGQTIREFLRRVIARRPEESASEGAAAQAESELEAPNAAPSDSVTGSIDALFSNAAPSDEDRSAADALAQAFGDWPEPTPIRGVPAHEASSELSLDHVFKANAPVPRRDDADAFSFDQFFSDELGQGAGGGEVEAGREPAERGEDIAQFNAWLNGLKKT